MNYFTLICSVAFLNLLAAMSPGPDFVMSVRNSLNYSRRTGIYTGIGIGLGIGIHISYCAAGVGFIIAQSITVFNIIKYIGAAYLIYMGISSMLAKKSAIEIREEKIMEDLTPFQAIKIGFLTNLLNPKATLFFLGLFSFVVNHDTPLPVILIIAFIMIATAIGWFTLVALFFTQKRIQLAFLKFENIINKSFGGLLILLGIKIALTNR